MLKKKYFFAVFFGIAVCSFIACIYACAGNAQEKMSAGKSTLDNLIAAHNGESNANARYLAFAEKANKEGYDAAAALFKAAALAEQVHFKRHAELIKKLGGTPNAVIETPVVKSTKENLEAALAGETYEYKTMYPEFLKQAEKEGIRGAIDAFEDAGAAEGVHAKMYAKMLENLAFSRGAIKDFYVCPVCGNVFDAVTLLKCPICSTDAKKFKKIRGGA